MGDGEETTTCYTVTHWCKRETTHKFKKTPPAKAGSPLSLWLRANYYGGTRRLGHLESVCSVCHAADGYLLQPYPDFPNRLPTATRNPAGADPVRIGRPCAPRMVRRPAPLTCSSLSLPSNSLAQLAHQVGGARVVIAL